MPLRWKIAGQVYAHVPDLRGRDRLSAWLRGSAPYHGPISGRLVAGNLRFDLPDCSDGSVRALVDLSYRPPALYPVLAAALEPGGCFYDVGANVGIYALSAARLVGPAGAVHAFEPVPDTAKIMLTLAEQNGLDCVRLVGSALGEREGEVTITIVAGASGLAHVGPGERGGGPDGITVPMTTLDGYWSGDQPPDLIKIDVEGHEAAVLRGATALLRAARPAVVVEMIPKHLARSGATPGDIAETLTACGYEFYDLTRRGPRLIVDPGAGNHTSSNVLAVAPCEERHRVILDRLRRARFPRNQTR